MDPNLFRILFMGLVLFKLSLVLYAYIYIWIELAFLFLECLDRNICN